MCVVNKQALEKHTFALYAADLKEIVHTKKVGDECSITNHDLVHRMVNVLRLQIGEPLILFDSTQHIEAQIISLVKKKVINIRLIAQKDNVMYKPSILFLLPLLKKDSFETALYSLTELGVTAIQLVATQKSILRWQEKDFERAHRIMMSAAEQSKNFSLPQLYPPVPLADALIRVQESDGERIFFDPAGAPVNDFIVRARKHTPESIIVLVGPEGDLTPAEKRQVQEANFVNYALTPTVLRACQAASVGIGIIRSVLR